MGVDVVNFGQMIDELEGKGLVERKIDPDDRRARKLYVTERGAALRRRLSPTCLPLRSACWRRYRKPARVAGHARARH